VRASVESAVVWRKVPDHLGVHQHSLEHPREIGEFAALPPEAHRGAADVVPYREKSARQRSSGRCGRRFRRRRRRNSAGTRLVQRGRCDEAVALQEHFGHGRFEAQDEGRFGVPAQEAPIQLFDDHGVGCVGGAVSASQRGEEEIVGGVALGQGDVLPEEAVQDAIRKERFARPLELTFEEAVFL